MIKKVIVFFLLFCLVQAVFAQSKKGQIIMLQAKVDSLNKHCGAINKKLDSLENIISDFNEKSDSMNALIEPEMVYVEGGTFQMGSNRYLNEQPVHAVTLNSFNIGKYEVTQAQWKAVMGYNPSFFCRCDCDNCPIENITFSDVKRFISELNRQTGKNYRLPTEAEWEYAAKGGKQSKGYAYSGSNNLNQVGWFGVISENKTHAVGSRIANELGIHDMSGNVEEWCSDGYGDYNSKSEMNPTGATSGWDKVIRGGSWQSSEILCRTAARNRGDAALSKGSNIGFRLVLPAVR